MTTKKLNPTEEQIKELGELEEVLSCLDQHGTGQTAPGRAYLRFYAELLALQTETVEDWNSSGEGSQIYRCDLAATPYHTVDNDGPCEVYTTNSDYAGCGAKVAHLCDVHQEEMAQAADKANAEREQYNLAKARGEDV